jgi:hypothetical protein
MTLESYKISTHAQAITKIRDKTTQEVKLYCKPCLKALLATRKSQQRWFFYLHRIIYFLLFCEKNVVAFVCFNSHY